MRYYKGAAVAITYFGVLACTFDRTVVFYIVDADALTPYPMEFAVRQNEAAGPLHNEKRAVSPPPYCDCSSYEMLLALGVARTHVPRLNA